MGNLRGRYGIFSGIAVITRGLTTSFRDKGQTGCLRGLSCSLEAKLEVPEVLLVGPEASLMAQKA